MRVLIIAAPVTFLLEPCVGRSQAFKELVITPSSLNEERRSRLRVLPNGDVSGRSIAIVELISLAYDVPANPTPRLSSLPNWTAGRRFDIEAKSPASHLTFGEAGKYAGGVRPLIRQILADGFGLVLSVREERVPVYALIAGKNGVHFNKTQRFDCVFDTSPQGCHSFAPGFGHPLDASAVTMSDPASYIENWTDSPVVNRTSLDGLFQLHSPGWKPKNLPPPPPGVTGSQDEFASLPSLSEVLKKLGLALRRQEESVRLYTVERIHEPDAK